MQAYNKAIAAFIGSLLPILVNWGVDVAWLTTELTAAISLVLATILTFVVRNKSA